MSPVLTLAEQRNRSLSAIRAAAFKIVEKEGVKGLSLTAVAFFAHVDRKTLYRCYPTMQHLLDAFAQEVVADVLAELLDGPYRENTAWWKWWSFVSGQPVRAQIVFASPSAMKTLADALVGAPTEEVPF